MFTHKLLFTSESILDVYNAVHYSLSMLNCFDFKFHKTETFYWYKAKNEKLEIVFELLKHPEGIMVELFKYKGKSEEFIEFLTNFKTGFNDQ